MSTNGPLLGGMELSKQFSTQAQFKSKWSMHVQSLFAFMTLQMVFVFHVSLTSGIGRSVNSLPIMLTPHYQPQITNIGVFSSKTGLIPHQTQGSPPTPRHKPLAFVGIHLLWRGTTPLFINKYVKIHMASIKSSNSRFPVASSPFVKMRTSVQ